MDLAVRVDERDGWAVATAHGDLDLTTAPRLREQVIDVVVGGQPCVVLDLQGVDFVDSTGLGVLVGLLKRTRTHGGDLRLVSSRTGLRKAIELTSLDLALPRYDNVDAAIGAGHPTGG